MPSPLTWSEAQYVRLSADLRAGRITERPVDTVNRYIRHTQRGITVTLTAPADRSVVSATTTVVGTTAPGRTVDVLAVSTDGDAAGTTATTTHGSEGTATSPSRWPFRGAPRAHRHGDGARAERPVSPSAPSPTTSSPGRCCSASTDPSGDDNGPGTFQYPTAADFKAGAYDLQRFEVYDTGDTVTFRVRTADLTPTFGSPPAPSSSTCTSATRRRADVDGRVVPAAQLPDRGRLGMEPADRGPGLRAALHRRGGATVGSVDISASAITRYITFRVTKAALGGTPGTGWTFTVVLHGQDGFSPDQARGFTTTPGGFQFGVCSQAEVDAGNPICAVDPGTVPKAMDVLTPAGVSQADELDPTKHDPVVIEGVRIS